MNYGEAIDSPERENFLEATQDTLREHLELDVVVEALGSEAIQRFRMLDNLLCPPLVEDTGFAYFPDVHRLRNSVPFAALRQGEKLRFDSEALMPTPAQINSTHGMLKKWSGETGESILLAQNKLVAQMGAAMPRTIDSISFDKDNAFGMVHAYGVPINGAELNLPNTPDIFMQLTRPVLILKYSKKYLPSVTLMHELSHIDWDLNFPIASMNQEVRTTEKYRNELRAYHYSGKYAEALASTDRKLKQMWKYPETAMHSRVESVRKKFADPERPFEPTPKLVAELGKAGIAWSA